MDPETRGYIENVDAWIKQIRTEFQEITDTSEVVTENVENIQHNYELIYELKEDIEILKIQIKRIALVLAGQYKIQKYHEEVITSLEPLLKDILVILNGKEIRRPRKEPHAVRDY